MNNCGYRGAFNMLNYLYNGLTSPPDNAGNLANLLNFDQAEFFALDPLVSSMSRSGFIYVPTACRSGTRCRLHISFHGCMQSRLVLLECFYFVCCHFEISNQILRTFSAEILEIRMRQGPVLWKWQK